MDYGKFWKSIRDQRGGVRITSANVPGTERIIKYGQARGTTLSRLAYILATAYHETAHLMMPVKEGLGLSDSWRRRNLRYYPWHGRGLIQTTWQSNYKKMSPIVGTDLIKNPDALLQWEYSLPALFIGMEQGLYTGKDLDDYIDENDNESKAEQMREYSNARRIVNGIDRRTLIADYAWEYERALECAHYNPNSYEPAEPGAVSLRVNSPHRTLVKELQGKLNEHGAKLTVDGAFGPKTQSAVIAFQRKFWDSPGEVTLKTWNLFKQGE